VKIREFNFPADYPAALKVWGSMEVGVQVGRSDSPEEIQRKLQRDPDLFLVAEENDEIVATIIGGYDGRRGMVYHLAVQQSFRKHGIGAQLLEEVERRLQARGCKKCYLLITADNLGAARFYEQRGWLEMKHDRIFAKEFP
jgi:ribosomal protein S18 acetylase RimI-like enzyme